MAREGHYPAAIEADLSEDRLRRFFVREADHYRVRQELRDLVLLRAIACSRIRRSRVSISSPAATC